MLAKLKNFLSNRWVRLTLGIAVSGVSLWLAFRTLSFSEITSSISQANPLFIILALVSVGVNTFAKALRWQVLLGPKGREVGIKKIFTSLLAGQFLNTVYPARLGDLSRAYVIGENGLPRTFVLGTVALEKMIELFSFSMLFVITLFFMRMPAWISESAYGLAFLTIVGSVVILLLASNLKWLTGVVKRLLNHAPLRIRKMLDRRLEAGLLSLEVLQQRRQLLWIAFYSIVVWGTAILNNYLIIQATALQVPMVASIFLLIVLQVSVSLPQVLPAGMGVYEYLCTIALAVFGIAQLPAVTTGLLLHTVVSGPVIVFGFICLMILSRTGAQPAHLEDLRAEITR